MMMPQVNLRKLTFINVAGAVAEPELSGVRISQKHQICGGNAIAALAIARRGSNRGGAR